MLLCLSLTVSFTSSLHRAGNSGHHMKNLQLSSLIRKSYAELSILLNGFNEIYQTWVSWIETFVVVLTVLSSAVAVLYFHPRGIVTAMISFPLLMYFIRTSGAVYDESEECLKYWKKAECKGTWFAKYRRSCRPLRIRFGNYFYADRGLTLTVLTTIVRETVSLVVTFSQIKHV